MRGTVIDVSFYDDISFLATIYGNSIRVQTLMTEKILMAEFSEK